MSQGLRARSAVSSRFAVSSCSRPVVEPDLTRARFLDEAVGRAHFSEPSLGAPPIPIILKSLIGWSRRRNSRGFELAAARFVVRIVVYPTLGEARAIGATHGSVPAATIKCPVPSGC